MNARWVFGWAAALLALAASCLSIEAADNTKRQRERLEELRGWIVIHCRSPRGCSLGGDGTISGGVDGSVTTTNPGGPNVTTIEVNDGGVLGCAQEYLGKSCNEYVDKGEPKEWKPPKKSNPVVYFPTPAKPLVASIDITGKTYDAVYGALSNIVNPNDGKNHFAYVTYPDPNPFSIVTYPVVGGVAVASVLGQLQITAHLPKWLDKNDAPSCLQKIWDKFYAGLEIHEQGHVNIFMKFQTYYKYELAKLPVVFPSEEAARAALEKAYTDALTYILSQQEAYDLSTGGGATQGATFPDCGDKGNPLSVKG